MPGGMFGPTGKIPEPEALPEVVLGEGGSSLVGYLAPRVADPEPRLRHKNFKGKLLKNPPS